MKIQDYPPILKSVDWQKEKSIIAKVLPGKKTGISEALADCERQYPALKSALAPLPDKAHLTPQIREAAAKFGLTVQHAREVAKDAASRWSARTSPVPKNTRLHAEKISKAADDYFKEVERLLQ